MEDIDIVYRKRQTYVFKRFYFVCLGIRKKKLFFLNHFSCSCSCARPCPAPVPTTAPTTTAPAVTPMPVTPMVCFDMCCYFFHKVKNYNFFQKTKSRFNQRPCPSNQRQYQCNQHQHQSSQHRSQSRFQHRSQHPSLPTINQRQLQRRRS